MRWLLELLGLRSKKGKVEISAPRHGAAMWHGLNEAQAALGMKHKGGRIKVSLKQANHVARSGRWGVTQPNGDVWGGGCISSTALWVAEHSGRVEHETVKHEMAHAVLFSHKIPTGDHHRIMTEKRI